MQVEQAVLEVLDRSEIQGNFLALPPGQLERALYLKVAKVIELSGGKWDRRAGKHLFSGSAADALEPVFLTGQIISAKSEFGFFETPPELAAAVVASCRIEPHDEVLEPSAGHGALAREALRYSPLVDAIELLPANFEALLEVENPTTKERLRNVTMCDFTLLEPRPLYDRIVMNPPFAKRADVIHISRAARFLREGGRLVAIASQAVEFRDDHLGREFRRMIHDRGGEIERLPPGSFKASGTDVNTVLVSFWA